ncbi:MAG: LuxR C-terminal-related transcriptional regulator [Anaerolineae bacterium]
MEIEPARLQSWLPGTKFHPPLLREDVIPRSRLLDALHDAVLSHPLTLVSTPAGFGKTTLLAEYGYWILGTGAPIPNIQYPISDIQNPRVAWLSLDVGDNDPVRFLTAFIFALQHLNPLCGATAQTLLAGPANPGAEAWRVISVLINDVLETLADPFALVLDDLHRINEPAIFAALDYLLEHMPPQMRLVAGTRVDPPLALARLRARGQVAELRLADLRFTLEETATFLNDRLGLGLSPDEAGILQTRTEGWAVGLRLLAAPLSRLPPGTDRRAFIEDLARTDRLVFDFLADEVLNQQEPQLRRFLLQTALLSELTPALCQAVTGRDDAAGLLEEVYRRNLFVVNLHSPISNLQSPTYRYHDLFAEFLRHRLQQELAERVPELHLRAAQAESDPARAVGHYLAAAAWPEAAELIEQIGAEMFARGYLDTLGRWINALPASVRESRPRLLHFLSNCAFWKGNWEEVQSLLERARQGFAAAGDGAGEGEVLANLAICAVFQADLERSGALFGQALTFPIPPHTRIESLLGRALSRLAVGDWAQAERDFKAAMALVQQAGEPDLLHLMTFYFLDPGLVFLPGGLEELERICRQARSQVGDQASPLRLVIEEMATVLHLFRGQLAEAIRTGESALSLRERLGGHPFSGMDAALYLMIAHAIRGDYAAVEPLFDLLFLGVSQTDPPPPDLAVYLFVAGRVRWLQGRLKEAREFYAQMCALENPQRETPDARICRAWMGSLLEMAAGRYGEAERALRRPEVLEQKDRCSTISGSTRLMLARLYLEQGRRQEALAELAPALAYHEQLGIPFAILVEGQSIAPLLRLAVEQGVHATYAAYLLDLLGADDEPHPLRVPHTGETLTPREVELLRLVVAGYSNRAIAERLVISEWTVKSHLTHIYRKLDVASRTQAIARARELGLS